nr:MAG TPA: hypothetical protein [Caudoviricetes sp.]
MRNRQSILIARKCAKNLTFTMNRAIYAHF